MFLFIIYLPYWDNVIRPILRLFLVIKLFPILEYCIDSPSYVYHGLFKYVIFFIYFLKCAVILCMFDVMQGPLGDRSEVLPSWERRQQEGKKATVPPTYKEAVMSGLGCQSDEAARVAEKRH